MSCSLCLYISTIFFNKKEKENLLLVSSRGSYVISRARFSVAVF